MHHKMTNNLFIMLAPTQKETIEKKEQNKEEEEKQKL